MKSVEKQDIPDIPGHLFKGVTWAKDKELLIGLYSPFLCPHGKMVVKWMGYEDNGCVVTFKIHSGPDKYKGKIATSKTDSGLEFVAGTERMLPFFLSL